MIRVTNRSLVMSIAAIATANCGDDGGDAAGENVTVLEISAGYRRSCALDVQGVMWCWGKNSETGGALEPQDPIPRKEVAFSAGGFSHVRVRMDDACAISAIGDLLCSYLGDVRTLSANVADFDQAVGSDEKPRSATPIGRDCLIRTDGTAFCGFTQQQIREESIVQNRAIAVGTDHFCALGVDSLVRCWGKGILGDGVDRRREAQAGGIVPEPVLPSSPVVLSELGTNVTDIQAGGYTTCVLKADRSVWCWGKWRGDVLERWEPALTPKRSQIPAAVSASVGMAMACALVVDGAVWCWGTNVQDTLYSELTTLRPFQVMGLPLKRLTSIAVGSYHACGVTADGEAWCWGQNTQGQTGVAKRTSKPVQVKGWGSVPFVQD